MGSKNNDENDMVEWVEKSTNLPFFLTATHEDNP